jgi:hypothetical protein
MQGLRNNTKSLSQDILSPGPSGVGGGTCSKSLRKHNNDQVKSVRFVTVVKNMSISICVMNSKRHLSFLFYFNKFGTDVVDHVLYIHRRNN